MWWGQKHSLYKGGEGTFKSKKSHFRIFLEWEYVSSTKPGYGYKHTCLESNSNHSPLIKTALLRVAYFLRVPLSGHDDVAIFNDFAK